MQQDRNPKDQHNRMNGFDRSPHITDEEYQKIDKARAAAMAEVTRQGYSRIMTAFTDWLSARKVDPQLPVHPGLLSLYLLECDETLGYKIATIEKVVSAIHDAHRSANLPSPTKHPDVVNMMKGLRRSKRGEGVKQAVPLTRDGLNAITATAHLPRARGRNHGVETETTARERGDVDIALLCTQFDGMLRVGELVEFIWGDIEYNPDGESGMACIRFSKTDQEGAGAYVWLSPRTMTSLERIRPPEANLSDSIFYMTKGTAGRRIKAAGSAAGLGDSLSGHSARVGMTLELVKAGLPLVLIMLAGRWTSAEMVPYYSRHLMAKEGAVAQWYEGADNVPDLSWFFRSNSCSPPGLCW